MMKVAGIAFLYSWALNRMGSNESNLLFYLPRAKLLSSLNPRQQLLRYCLVPNLNPVDMELSSNVGFLPHRVCFSHAKPVQLTFLAFINNFFLTSGVKPGYHIIILTNTSMAIFPRCVSSTFAKSNVRFWWNKGKTPLKKTPLFVVKASFCFSNNFSTFKHCFQSPHLIFLIMSWNCLFAPNMGPVSSWVTKSFWAKPMLTTA